MYEQEFNEKNKLGMCELGVRAYIYIWYVGVLTVMSMWESLHVFWVCVLDVFFVCVCVCGGGYACVCGYHLTVCMCGVDVRVCVRERGRGRWCVCDMDTYAWYGAYR